MLLRSRNLLRFHAIGLGRPTGYSPDVNCHSERMRRMTVATKLPASGRSEPQFCPMEALLWILRLKPQNNSRPLVARAGAIPGRRLDTWCLPPLAAPLLFLHAANGETVRTVVDALGVHVGTVEAQVRPVHARRRVRRTAPGETICAHIEQATGTAATGTRSVFL